MTDSTGLEKLRTAAVSRAAEVLVLTLRSQGVFEVTALEFVEREVTLEVGPGLKIYAVAGELRARGSTDEHLTHFARLLHLHFAEQLGGTPVPFGTDAGPAFEGAMQQAAKITAARKAAVAAMARAEAHQAEIGQEQREAAAAFRMARAPDPRRVF